MNGICKQLETKKIPILWEIWTISLWKWYGKTDIIWFPLKFWEEVEININE